MYIDGPYYETHNPWPMVHHYSLPATPATGSQMGGMPAPALHCVMNEPATLFVGFSLDVYDPILMAALAGEI